MNEIFLEIAVPVPLYQTFWYRFQTESLENFIGRRVIVPFKSTKSYGLVVGISNSIKNVPVEYRNKLKDIIKIDDFQVFTEKEINVIKKISDYYLSPIGLTVDFFIPNILREKAIKDPLAFKVFNINENVKLKKISETAKKIIQIIQENQEVSYEDLLSLGFSKRSIKSLLEKSILIPVESSIKIKTSVFKQPKTSEYTPKLLGSQIYVYDRFYFKDRLKAYISLIKKYAKTNKSVLIVVPSIAFGNKLYKDLSQKFENVYFYHDGINPKLQFEIFKEITRNPSFVIGTVSSLLIPIKDLNLIILEQEHSSAYKVLRSPRFETKRVLYYIHKEKNIPIILASSILSIESYLINATNLKKDKDVIKSYVEINPFKSTNKTLNKLQSLISEKGKTLILTHKSYYSGFIYCPRCEWEAVCPTCDVPLKTYIQNNTKIFRCPSCKKRFEYFKTCPECDFKLKETGFGKEFVFEFLKKSDKLAKLLDSNKIIVESSLKDILQFESFDMVINLYPDFILDLPDYRSNEKFLRSVISPLTVAKDSYIIFSNTLENWLVENIGTKSFDVNQILENFYKKEAAYRKKNKLPPFLKLVRFKIVFKPNQKEYVEKVLKEISRLKIYSFFQKSNSFIYYFEYKSEKEKQMIKVLAEKLLKKGLDVIIEVDPKSF
ncbi:hypothetical protein [Sulfurihydrogenibium sp.]|uniref:primosomal protein N' family DNA-binding protein n=1 Tax=Sulfurihydrogenibium sp. TaxID=2053621 RepID=UPI00261E7501|nr:hypothetical protein [Sulfurihydrogenibium sp.]